MTHNMVQKLCNLKLLYSQQVPWSLEHAKREAITSLSLIFKAYQVYMIKIIVYWFYIWNRIILQRSSTYFKWSELITWVSVHVTRGLFECLDIQ